MDPCTQAQADTVAEGADTPVTASDAIERADTETPPLSAVPLSDADLDHVAGGTSPNAAHGVGSMRRLRGA